VAIVAAVALVVGTRRAAADGRAMADAVPAPARLAARAAAPVLAALSEANLPPSLARPLADAVVPAIALAASRVARLRASLAAPLAVLAAALLARWAARRAASRRLAGAARRLAKLVARRDAARARLADDSRFLSVLGLMTRSDPAAVAAAVLGAGGIARSVWERAAADAGVALEGGAHIAPPRTAAEARAEGARPAPSKVPSRVGALAAMASQGALRVAGSWLEEAENEVRGETGGGAGARRRSPPTSPPAAGAVEPAGKGRGAKGLEGG